MNEDRAISAADFGYLLLLFMALYVIRGIVVLSAYPILRTVGAVLFPFSKCLTKVPETESGKEPMHIPIALTLIVFGRASAFA